MLAVGVHAQFVRRRRDVNRMFRAIVVGSRFKRNELTVLPGFVAGMFVTIGLDEHHLHGKVRLDLYSGRIVLALDVERSRADFIISADNVEDPMDLGRGSGIIDARWQNWRCEESEGKGNRSHNDHSLFADCSTDWIVVGGDQGYVRRINVRSTEIETFDRSQVIIPNSNLVTGVVTNLVRNDRTGRIIIPLTVSGSANPEKVREVLIAIAKSHELVLNIPAPQVLFTGMSASALNFELRVFLSDVETIFRVKSDLHFEIFRRFKGEKFFDTPGPDATKVEIVGFENLGRL